MGSLPWDNNETKKKIYKDFMIKYYVLDLETNGLMWRNNFHEICEFSIIRTDDRMQLTKQVRVDKVENSSFDALRICNKTANDLKNGISKKELVEEAEKFILEDGLTPEHRCLVGHNIINFDRKFLWQLWSSFKKEFPFVLFLDTIHMMRSYAKKNQLIKPALNLQASCDILKIKKMGAAHTALHDTRNTFLLWQELTKTVDYLEHIKRIPYDDE
jgi:hypothetical protein